MARVSPNKLIEEGSVELKRAVADMENGYNAFVIDNKKPGFTYIWAAKDLTHPQSVDRQKALGYEIVNEGPEVAPFAEVQTTQNGTVMTREHILMRIPTEYAEYRNKRASEIGHERVQTMKDDLQENIERTGSRILKSDKSVF